MNVLVTGAAGFIGFNLSKKLLEKNIKVYGVDNLNDYYEKKIKFDRLKILKKYKSFYFFKADLNNEKKVQKILKKKISFIFHLAGQAGVRYSIKNPKQYIKDNCLAFINILEAAKNNKKIKLILFASSSSVYGENQNYKSNFSTISVKSVYAASKLSMEALAKVYYNLYNLKSIAIRFFTVYGPFGRPDMAYYKFSKFIFKKKTLQIYNSGDHFRSFTYIDDVVENLIKIVNRYKKLDFLKNNSFNIGNPKSVSLKTFVKTLEKIIGIKAKTKIMKKQLGDVYKTKANTKIEKKLFKFEFNTSLKQGLEKFIYWYKKYYNQK